MTGRHKIERTVPAAAHQVQTAANAGQVLALDIDQFQPREITGHFTVDRFDKAGFPHAPRTPQKRVIGGMSPCELIGIGQKRIAGPIDANQKPDIDTVYTGDRLQTIRFSMPDESRSRGKVRRRRRRWRRNAQLILAIDSS